MNKKLALHLALFIIVMSFVTYIIEVYFKPQLYIEFLIGWYSCMLMEYIFFETPDLKDKYKN